MGSSSEFKSMNFLKMEGIGNDFIVTHEVAPGQVERIARHAAVLCDRRKGIGADGIIFVLPSDKADLRMRIFNSDGSEAEMCGNGIRCLALYAKSLDMTNMSALSIETLAGIIKTMFVGDMVKVNMGRPVLDAPRIPVAKSQGKMISEELEVGDKSFKITALSMGNPHAVIYAGELSDELVLGYGPLIESHPFFPKKVNAEFVQVISEREIAMRVFERGCGETQACGTGACASVVSGIINKLHGTDVLVHLPGGNLQVEWDGDERSPVFMTGPARIAFKGNVELGE